MWAWIKKHKVAFAVICLLVVFALIGVPLLINVLFKIDSGICALQAEWSAGDALGYYGAVLSFLGTVVLSALALYQNHIIKVEADKKATMLEERERIKNMPKFCTRSLSFSGEYAKISFDIENISENIAHEIKVYDFFIQGEEKFFQGVEWSVSTHKLDPKERFTVDTKTPPLGNVKSFQMTARMSCKDKYGDSHEYLLKIKHVGPRQTEYADVKEIVG